MYSINIKAQVVSFSAQPFVPRHWLLTASAAIKKKNRSKFKVRAALQQNYPTSPIVYETM